MLLHYTISALPPACRCLPIATPTEARRKDAAPLPHAASAAPLVVFDDRAAMRAPAARYGAPLLLWFYCGDMSDDVQRRRQH